MKLLTYLIFISVMYTCSSKKKVEETTPETAQESIVTSQPQRSENQDVEPVHVQKPQEAKNEMVSSKPLETDNPSLSKGKRELPSKTPSVFSGMSDEYVFVKTKKSFPWNQYASSFVRVKEHPRGNFIKVNDKQSTAEIANLVSELNSRDDVIFAGVCKKNGNQMVAFNNEVMIGFNDNSELENLKTFLVENDISYSKLEQNQFNENQYLLIISKNEEMNSEQISRVVSELPYIKYSDPNYFFMNMQ